MWLPTDVSTLQIASKGAGGADPLKLRTVNVSEQTGVDPRTLGDWALESYFAGGSRAASLGYSGAEAKANSRSQVFVYDFSRYVDVDAGDHTERWGVAVRYAVTVTGLSADGGMSIPLLAARLELEKAQQSVSLRVRGYTNDSLNELIAQVPLSLDVESFQSVIELTRKIQRQVAGGMTEHPEFVRPALLAVNSKYEQQVNALDSIATAFALASIKKGRAYDHCLQEAVMRAGQDATTAAAVSASIAEVYRNLLGENFQDAELTGWAIGQATEMLGSWRLEFD